MPRGRLFAVLLAAALTEVGRAALAQPAASAPDYSGVKYGPMAKLRCPDGEYRGPEPGKKVWQKDDYTWFVSRSFAQRFCMPEAMVDGTLKGAEAVAFRVKPSETATCRLEGGQEVCRRKAEFQLELYLRSDLNLPKAFPEVRFFVRDVESSGSVIETNQSLKNHYRRSAGAYRDPAGQLHPYHVASSPDQKERQVKFMYLNFGDPNLAQPGSDLVERYYQAGWIDGIDLIRVDSGTSLGMGILSHASTRLASRRFGIGIVRMAELPSDREGKLKMTRDRYVHIIELPERLSELIYRYDKQQGDLLVNAVRQVLGVQPSAPTPSDMEPLVPPAHR